MLACVTSHVLGRETSTLGFGGVKGGIQRLGKIPVFDDALVHQLTEALAWHCVRPPLNVLLRLALAYTPIFPPPRLVIASTEGRGGMSGLKSGQRVDGVSKSAGCAFGSFSSASPGCCTARNNVSSSGVKNGPHISAPTGTRKNSFEVPRSGPSVSSPQSPSLRPVFDTALPSVAIHTLPWLSTARLSGMPNQPLRVVLGEKVAPTAAIDGSPQRTRISQRARGAV